MSLPIYCCVILHCAADDTILLEHRPPTCSVAPSRLTCFGGKREPHEAPHVCALRELMEELSWVPPALTPGLDLLVDGVLTAHFFTAPAPPLDAPLVYEAGREGVRLPLQAALLDPRISPWHACVLEAWQRGLTRAHFRESSGSPPPGAV